MESVRVELANRSHDVLIGFDVLPGLAEALRDRGLLRESVAVFTSPTIGGHYFAAVHDALRQAGVAEIGRWDIPDGEQSKDLDNFAHAVRWLARYAPDPSVEPLVLTLGGGVVGDLGGFAAACFRRGVPYVQVPTTLLAAVDSSVGGKTAVNLPEGKNLVGAFYQPRLVYVDLATLRTLPAREVRSGLSEVIKYGVALDAELFASIEESVEALAGLEAEPMMRVVARCVELKADVVRRDELDREHVRICLNFGHTLGHAVEKAADGALTHGEAVAVGMVAAARISTALGLMDSGRVECVEGLLVHAGLPTRAEGVELESVLSFMAHDKKFVAGRNRFVLLADIGQWVEREGVPMDVVRDAARSVLS